MNNRITSAELHSRIETNGIVDKWSQYFTERLRAAIKKHRIGVTGNLNRSIVRELKRTNGDVTSVLVKFAMYGRFVDMGVGNGLKAYERGSNKSLKSGARLGAKVSYVNRKPKRWYNKVGRAQLYKLRELLEKEMQEAAVYNLKDGFGGGTTNYDLRI